MYFFTDPTSTVYRFTLPVVFCLLCLFFCPLAASGQSSSEQDLARSIDRLFDQEDYTNAIWAAKIVDLSTGTTLYERNADISLMPASNAKLYTVAAALDILGPSFRFETVFYSDGPTVQGVLEGNLFIRGSGDPAIGGRYYDDEDPTAAFREIARSLRAEGIRVIEGNIIGDDNFFDDTSLGVGWSWDDEPYYFSAEISALSFYDNAVQFITAGQRQGMPASLRWNPLQTTYVDVTNRSITIHPDSSKDIEYERPRNFNHIDVHSEVPAGLIDTTYISVSNPTLYFVHVFRQVLLQEGITVKGDILDVDDLAIVPKYEVRRLRQQAVHTSPPLSEIVATLNKESQNLYAELLIRTLGVHHPVNDPDIEPGSSEMGLSAAMATFARADVDTSRIQLVDGSGLSRMNLITASMTANLLTYMWNHPYATVREAFYDSLPIGGIDGTLENRFRSGAAYQNVRAKTGTLTGASSLSGYVFSNAETPLLFVLMCNNYTVKTSLVRKTQDQIVRLLAEYPR